MKVVDVEDKTENTPVEVVDLGEMLSQYKKPMTIEAPADFVKQDDPITDDKSDPTKYFQSGAKKGQPRQRKPRANATAAPTPEAKPAGITGELITGALFLTLIDLLFPMLVAAINNRFSKQKIEASVLQLDAKQKKELEPLSDEVVKYINITGHPVALFLIAYCGIVGINLMQVKMLQNATKKTP